MLTLSLLVGEAVGDVRRHDDALVGGCCVVVVIVRGLVDDRKEISQR